MSLKILQPQISLCQKESLSLATRDPAKTSPEPDTDTSCDDAYLFHDPPLLSIITSRLITTVSIKEKRKWS